MTKKAVAARRRYRAKKNGVPTRRKRGAGTFGQLLRKKTNVKRGAGVRRKRRGRGRGRGRGAKGAGFWEDVGGFFTHVGETALQVLPMIL